MAYDTYDKFPRATAEPNYFEATDPRNYSSQFSTEPRDTTTAFSSSATPMTRKDDSDYPSSTYVQPSVEEAENHTSPPPDLTGPTTVSPELIAELTERIKNEVVQHLKQTGTIETPTEQSSSTSHPPLQRQPSNKSSTTSSPSPDDRKIYTPPSPTSTKPVRFSTSPQMGPRHSPPHSPVDKPAAPRFTHNRKASAGDNHDDKENYKRHATMGRTFSTIELSTIDQKWGRLFEAEHTPTPRLGQFLKGLANRIVEEYEPKKSIVITPEKMAQFYSNHALDRETHPMIAIFKSGKHKQISGLYQDLSCQHHLVQDRPESSPTVPGLTPYGFAQWMTIAILAYPDEEAQRFDQVAVALPIDADGQMIDGKPERLPKQMSRHLLPSREHRKSRSLLDEAVADFLDYAGKAEIPKRRATIASPPLSRRQSMTIDSAMESPLPSPLANPVERERMPYGGIPSAAVSDTDGHPTGIERERKPYTAQPGAGKIHSDAINLSALPAGHQRPNRTSSIDDRSTPIDTNRYSRLTAQKSGAGRNRQASPPFRGGRTSEPVLDTSTGGYGGIPSLNSAASAPVGYKNFSPLHGPIPPNARASFDSRDQNASVGMEREREDESERSRRYPPSTRDRERDHNRNLDRESTRERDKARTCHSHLPIPPASTSQASRRNMTVDDETATRLSFTGPRDAERYGRFYEGRSVGGERGAGVEDYYRERDRGGRMRGRDLEG